MVSPVFALLWQTWGRHRWGLAAAVVVLGGLIGLHRAQPTEVWRGDAQAVLFVLPVAFVFVYLFYAFSYAEHGGQGRGTGVPAWMFTLPVRTWLVVAPPMVSGTAAIALTWLVAARFILQPLGLEVPLAAPALGLAVTLAGVQALEWSPLSNYVKVPVALGLLAGIWYGVINDATQAMMLVLLPLLLLLAFVAAVAGVRRTRHGGPAGGGRPALASAVAEARRERAPFDSAARAQLWLECRRNGVLLPVVFAGCLLLETLQLLMGEVHAVRGMLISNVYVLPYLAILIGCLLGKPDMWDRAFRLTPFAASRPMDSGRLVLAKLRMTALSLLVGEGLLVGFGIVWGLWLGDDGLVGAWRHFFPSETGPEAYVLLPVALVGLIGMTWLQLAGHLFAGLTGRLWVFAAVVLCYMVVFPDLLALNSGFAESEPGFAASLETLLPWLLWGVIGVKFLAAAVVFGSTLRRRLFHWSTIGSLLAVWWVSVACLGALSVLMIKDQYQSWAEIPGRAVALTIGMVVLLCPLTRIGLAPLALEWNRHR